MQSIHIKHKAICCFNNSTTISNGQLSFLRSQATFCQRNTSACAYISSICVDCSAILCIGSACNNLQLAIIALCLSLYITTIQSNLLCRDINAIATHLHIILHSEVITGINISTANLHAATRQQHII